MNDQQGQLEAVAWVSFWQGVAAVSRTPIMYDAPLCPTRESEAIQEVLKAIVPPSRLHAELRGLQKGTPRALEIERLIRCSVEVFDAQRKRAFDAEIERRFAIIAAERAEEPLP